MIDTRTAEGRRALLESLLLPRLIEERMRVLLRQGLLSKWFSGVGQEAVSVGVTSVLRDGDPLLPMHRNLGVFTTRGVPLGPLFRQLLGREGGFTRGRDRSFHFADPSRQIYGMISHLGATLSLGDGLALAAHLDGRDDVAVCFVGDGATSEGDFHEALNLAAVWRLPVVFIIENNQYGLSTPVAEQYACAALADRGVGYGMPGCQVDGNDVLAVREVVAEAVGRARAGDGPSLVECLTFRMRGHEEASGTAYVPAALLEAWAKRDPIDRYAQGLMAAGELDAAELDGIKRRLFDTVRAAADQALAAPLPTSDRATELAAVVAASPPAIPPERPPASPSRTVRYVDAIADALALQLARDPRTVLMGQDIAEYGGAFKVTAGLAERFGKARVRNTPIIESGALGAAMGLALAGYRPMVEIQFADFISCGFNQIVNHLAKTRYRWGGEVPVVIRAPQGGGLGAGPFHSQSIEAFFTHVPGLKVVAPATPEDAKGLLLAAFLERDPVLFLEHKKLYRTLEGPVPEGYYTTQIGAAKVVRDGADATVLTYGVGVHWALEAAEILAPTASIEVVDLRTLQPWDQEICIESARRTGRVLVLHEATQTGGFGAEIAATIARRAFEWLDAPVERLGALDTPVPFAKALEALHSPKDRIVETLERLLGY